MCGRRGESVHVALLKADKQVYLQAYRVTGERADKASELRTRLHGASEYFGTGVHDGRECARTVGSGRESGEGGAFEGGLEREDGADFNGLRAFRLQVHQRQALWLGGQRKETVERGLGGGSIGSASPNSPFE